jgi:hypothetical protein
MITLKVICLWRRSEGLTEMQKYYTKKVRKKVGRTFTYWAIV